MENFLFVFINRKMSFNVNVNDGTKHLKTQVVTKNTRRETEIK